MHKEILDKLKDTAGYLSGAKLGEELGVSRAAIWKEIRRLRNEGYEIEAVNNKGYRLMKGQELFNQTELREGIDTKKLGHPVFFYETTDSTNLSLRRLAQEGKPEGTLAVAQMQTAGRGRMGRHWIAPAGTGIWMSLLLRPETMPKDAPVITLLAGLAVCRAIRKLLGLMVQIKWPNDILLNEKKLCGILTEMDAEMDCIRCIVLGIGINVNIMKFPEDIVQSATSLKKEAGCEEDILRIPLINAVLMEFEEIYCQFQKDYDFTPFLPEYIQLCHTIGKQVQVLSKKTFCGYAANVTPNGELVVRKEDGEEVLVYSGEVSVRVAGR